jgi:perosamine synthetase
MNPIAFSRPCFGPEEAAAAAAAVSSGWVVGGPRLREFEDRFAAVSGAPYAVGVSSWTTGAFLVLHAWGIGPGDEVLVPSLTFIASVNVIIHAGARPVFVDVDPRTWNIDPTLIESKITPRTKAIIAVDQLGLPCEIDAINEIAERHRLRVIQDAACSFASRDKGRPIGSLAPISIFSLHARKVITTGEGGMIVTTDAEFAARLRMLRHQGMSLSDYARHNSSPTTFETYPEVGYNFRMTDIQAGIGLAQLDRLEHILARRREIADTYRAGLAGIRFVTAPHVPENLTPNWQSYQITLSRDAPVSRDEVMEQLYRRGIPTRRGVMASHLEAALAPHTTSLPRSEAAAEQCLQLPMYPALENDQQNFILSALQDIMGSI